MKKLKLIIFNIFLMFFLFQNLVNAQISAEGIYHGTVITYAKNHIQASIRIDSMKNQMFMNKVNLYLNDLGAKIDTINLVFNLSDSLSTYKFVLIKLLNDSMDALIYIPIIQKSGFFYQLFPDQATYPIDSQQPINDLFNNKEYYFQDRDTIEQNHSLLKCS